MSIAENCAGGLYGKFGGYKTKASKTRPESHAKDAAKLS
jgi:hypothetical protein